MEVRMPDSPRDECSPEEAGAASSEAGCEPPGRGGAGGDRDLADAEQTLADTDQTAADSDQTAADSDEQSSASDQAASDRDQAASDRDLAQGGDRGVHDASRGSRARATERRIQGTRRRSEGAASRDEVANARDRAAELRDQAAERLDLDLEARDAEWSTDVAGGYPSKAKADLDRAAADRGQAADARGRAAADREQAAHDREHAASYRFVTREEQAALLRQVAISETDPLTGARARGAGLADLEVEIGRVQRSTGLLAVAYVDVVGLKAVNDSQGHAAGDTLLETTVRVIREHLRAYDVIIRIGGDEFVCVMSGATVDDACRRFEGIQADAADTGLGIRFGIAALRPGDGPNDVVERADSELVQGPQPAAGRPRSSATRRSQVVDRPRILVTADRPEMRAAVEHALAARYVCEFADDVAEAAEALGAARFDLLLCDLQSGGESALALARETVRGNLDTAVIMVAEEEDPAAAESAFEFGAFGYVVRPLPGQLLITVMNALRRRELEVAERERSQNLEDRRQTIIDMAPISIYAIDTSGHYVVANDKADELAGMKPGGLIGSTDKAFVAPDDLEIASAAVRRVLEERVPHASEDTVEIEGEEKTFKTIRFPLLDERGEITAVGGISVDVSAENESIRLRDELAAAQQSAIEELELSRQETIEGLAKAIDLHDSSTGEHVQRMASIAAFLGARLGLDPERVQLLGAAAPMHDVGKIGTPASILRKPGALTEAERRVMERHTVVGHAIFAPLQSELSQMAATIALTHHERYDGGGYPHGIAGEEIPLEGRIAAVADVFDALLSDRSYRPAMSVSEAVAIMKEGRGTHFDPRIADVLLDHLEEALSIRA
jgi:diguanylate cyclase (GGDEF)-like protein/PAS domain S-box-containing protein